MDSRNGFESVEPITAEALRHYVERGRRLRSEAVASALRAAARVVFLAERQHVFVDKRDPLDRYYTPDAVAHERRERARRVRRAWAVGGLSGDGLPGGAR